MAKNRYLKGDFKQGLGKISLFEDKPKLKLRLKLGGLKDD